MSLSSKKTASTSTTSNVSTTQLTDQSANAGGDNSLAVGQGATVTIESLSDDVAAKALSTTGDVASQAINTSGSVAAHAVNTVAGITQASFRDQASARNQQNLQSQENASLAQALSELAVGSVAESRRDPDNQILSNPVVIVAVAATVIAVGYFLTRK